MGTPERLGVEGGDCGPGRHLGLTLPFSSTSLGPRKVKLWVSALCVGVLGLATTASADILVVTIDAATLPYDLGPNKYDNSPSKYANSPNKYENSEAKYANSKDKYDNSFAKYENGPNGDRRLLNARNEMVGYYVFSDDGVLNLYNSSKRIAYIPSGGETRSLFLSAEEGWCGTLGELNGKTVIGLTKACLLRFLLED